MKIKYILPDNTEIIKDHQECIVIDSEAVKLNNVYYSIANIVNNDSDIAQTITLQVFNEQTESDILLEKMCDNSDYIVIFRYPVDQKELAIDTIRKLSPGHILGLPTQKTADGSFLWDLTSVKVS